MLDWIGLNRKNTREYDSVCLRLTTNKSASPFALFTHCRPAIDASLHATPNLLFAVELAPVIMHVAQRALSNACLTPICYCTQSNTNYKSLTEEP